MTIFILIIVTIAPMTSPKITEHTGRGRTVSSAPPATDPKTKLHTSYTQLKWFLAIS